MDNIDDMSCPVCIEKGDKYCVNLLQINSDYASYFCENEMKRIQEDVLPAILEIANISQCMYPGISKGCIPVMRRDPKDMPVPSELIKRLGLPESLSCEPDLKTSHLSLLTELNALLPYAENIFRIEDNWTLLIQRMKKYGIKTVHVKGLENLPDPDYIKLKQIVPKVKSFLKYFSTKPSVLERLLTMK